LASPPLVLSCPTCGASNQTGSTCRRCRSDLRLLHRLEADRAAEAHKLVQALAEQRWDEALLSAQYMHRLRQDEQSARYLAVCQLLMHQFAAACDTYRQYQASYPVVS
jgi:methylphosphotriester-DNA--protein-cysteine methyltransferase